MLPSGPTLRHVLVIGVDGVRFDLLLASHLRQPALNLIDPVTIIALRELMDKRAADRAVKVVVLDSADEGEGFRGA